ncbi:MAG: hypothetical protein HY751_03105 [Nitrospinae bacterium]|nr:hypothetical protein [Nitrospinota bacterium]
MKRVIMLVAIFFMVIATTAMAADKPVKIRQNRVDFGPFTPGAPLFLETAPALKDSGQTNWLKFTKDADKLSVWAPAPEDIKISERIAAKIPVMTVTSPEQGCGSAPRLLFLSGPVAAVTTAAETKPAATGKLYSYEYVVCDPSGLLTPESMTDQYISKYGMYDGKDYDRQMIFYKNVQGHYRVGVRPFTGGDRAGLMVTVVDENVFREVYQQWRGVIRSASKRVLSEF